MKNDEASTDTIETLDWPCEWTDSITGTFPRLNGHHVAWIDSIVEGLRHRCYLVRAHRDDEVTGVLPLCLVRGPIFGRFLVSLPYLNTGGVWARDDKVAYQLVEAACELADRLDVRYLELRHEIPVDHPRLNFQREDKVHMRLKLPGTAAEMMKSLKSRVRSQVKKSGTYGSTFSFGGMDHLDAFYEVFAHNMRDLGTPVFSRGLFASILQEFDGDAELCVVRNEGQPVAAGLLVHSRGVTEVPSASCLRSFNRTNANMFMYQHLLARAIERGSHTFDFGRSSKESGPYRFKKQWGAEPYPAVWQYYVRKGSVDAMRPDSDGNQRLIRIWQRLPVALTKAIGPAIVRGIP